MMEPAKQTVLEISGLKLHFGNVAAVNGVNLSVRAGENYGFPGINGADKTTTIRALMGIIATETGTIHVMGGEPTRRTNVKQKRRIGYVSQQQNFYRGCQLWSTQRHPPQAKRPE